MVRVKIVFSNDIYYVKMIFKEMLYYTIITIYMATSMSYVATSQKIGESCILKNGLRGVCKSISECSDSVDKAFHGESFVFCNFEPDIPIVCCGETLNFQPLSEPSRKISAENIYFTSNRNPRRDTPWWLQDSPFVGNKNSTHSNENLDSPWWFHDTSFHAPSSKPLPPTIPPSPVRHTSSSPVRHTTSPSHIRQTPPPVTIRTQTTSQTPRRTQYPVSTRKSEIKCNEYSKLALDQVSALPLLPAPEPVPIDVPKCEVSSLELIVGGEEAKPKEFPHMAALGYRDAGAIEWRCGGSLISEYYVLTAAHCTPNKNPPIIARLGELNLKRDDDLAAPVDYKIVERLRHPDYKPPAKYNDIALLKLDRRVQFNNYIRPACLYTKDWFSVNKTVATGWGKIDFAERQSDTLLKVPISIIDNKLCNDLYEQDSPTRELTRGIQPTMLCAGELMGGKDTCQGDSGGPIQIIRPNNRCVYNIIGVTSFGKFCAAKNAPGVYTRVSAFVPWIENIVWPDS